MQGLNSRLKMLRKKKNIQIKELAKMIGVSVSTYCGYETDEKNSHFREPSLDKIKILAKYYNVSLDFICGNSELVHNHDKYYIIEMIRADKSLDEDIKNITIKTIDKSLAIV